MQTVRCLSVKKETDLAAQVVAWLNEQHWDVYQEVQFNRQSGVADIVAVRGAALWIIECKTSYSFTVLNQAAGWPVRYRSVAVPAAKERDYGVAERYYRVGVIEVGFSGVVERVPAPVFCRRVDFDRRWIGQLTDLHKTFAPAGSQSGHHLTPYKRTMMEVRQFVEAHPGCTVKDLFEKYGPMHYASKESFKGNIVKCLMHFEKDWCNVDTSKKPFRIFPSGTQHSVQATEDHRA